MALQIVLEDGVLWVQGARHAPPPAGGGGGIEVLPTKLLLGQRVHLAVPALPHHPEVAPPSLWVWTRRGSCLRRTRLRLGLALRYSLGHNSNI